MEQKIVLIRKVPRRLKNTKYTLYLQCSVDESREQDFSMSEINRFAINFFKSVIKMSVYHFMVSSRKMHRSFETQVYVLFSAIAERN